MPRSTHKRRRKRRIGRPSKYSAAVVQRICKAVAEGCSREAAASLGGITKDTLYEWSRRFPAFSDRLEKADACFQRMCIAELLKAPKRHPRNWASHAWLLERKFPEQYGKIERHLIKSQTTRMPLPAEYVEAVNRALGITDKVVPIKRPNPAIDVSRELPALPEPAAELDDSGELEILPQLDPNAPIQ